jgi:hypothetical protein
MGIHWELERNILGTKRKNEKNPPPPPFFPNPKLKRRKKIKAL